MIDVANRAYVYMRFLAFEFFLGHSVTPIPDYDFLEMASAMLAGTSAYLVNSML
jgi:hypothetical protein